MSTKPDNVSERLPRERPVGPMLVVVAVATLGIGAIWALAVTIGPDVCGLSYPGPRNCFIHDRADAALLPTVLIGALTAIAVAAIALAPRMRRAVTIIGCGLMLVLIAVSYVHVAWVPALA